MLPKKNITMVALVALLLVPTTSFADEGRTPPSAKPDTGWMQHPPQGGPPHDWLQMAKENGLSDAQIAKIQKVHFKMKRLMIPLHAKARMARLNLEEAMSADKTPSEDQVLQLVSELNAVEGEIKKTRIMMLLNIREIVSPAQWRKIHTMMSAKKHNFRRKMMMHRMGGEEGDDADDGER